MAEVACLIAGTAVPVVTSTLSWTNSAAISDKRSLRPSPQRFDPMVRPSIQPSSRSRCTKAAVHAVMAKPMPALEIRWLAASLDVASISDCGCKASCYGLSWRVPPPALKRRNRKLEIMPPSFSNHSRYGTRLGHVRVSLKQPNGLQGQGP